MINDSFITRVRQTVSSHLALGLPFGVFRHFRVGVRRTLRLSPLSCSRDLMRLSVPALCCCVLACVAGGCGQPAPVGSSEPLVQLNSTADFNSTVLDSRKPGIVMFYKEGCPACAKLEVLLGQLAAEYHGRAVFAKYPMATPLGIVKNRELRDKFEVYVWPTAMLFFDEREKKRWLTNDFPPDVFRKDLDEILSTGKDSAGRVTK